MPSKSVRTDAADQERPQDTHNQQKQAVSALKTIKRKGGALGGAVAAAFHAVGGDEGVFQAPSEEDGKNA